MNKTTEQPAAEMLLLWYDKNRRDFPWRLDPTPYKVWVSEIMLQQTRIEAALPYFTRFIETLPDIEALAAVGEERLLKLWEGLGYYSRARNLHKAARIVCEKFGGQLPADYKELKKLPGIGEYTAGAIASAAFCIPVTAIDGNVLRVMARLQNDHGDVLSAPVKAKLKKKTESMLSKSRPGDFNQALMELGERVCLPNTVPLCKKCPLQSFCAGYVNGHPEDLPLRIKRTERRIERRTVCIVLSEKGVLLHKRGQKGLLAGLWELPNTEGFLEPEEAAAYVAALTGNKPLCAEPLKEAKHLFTHIEWRMKGVKLTVVAFEPPPGYLWVKPLELKSAYALPSAFKAFINQIS